MARATLAHGRDASEAFTNLAVALRWGAGKVSRGERRWPHLLVGRRPPKSRADYDRSKGRGRIDAAKNLNTSLVRSSHVHLGARQPGSRSTSPMGGPQSASSFRTVIRFHILYRRFDCE